ncbi:MAG: molybdopterin-dependent oxidoreductase [Nitrospirae bacterium]|nr:molybdopterin-dependent oxidoreductase [Nitrospirota bacterium]
MSRESKPKAQNKIDRREFLAVAAVAATVAACEQPKKSFISPISYPEGYLPGAPTWVSTTCGMCPAGCGIQVKVLDGNAKKIEGNPAHPVNHGRICARGQAGLQLLYHPDRVTQPLKKATAGALQPATWPEAIELVVARLRTLREQGQSDRVAVVTPHLTAGRKALVDAFLRALGAGTDKHIVHEILNAEPLRAANRLLFERAEIPVYRLDQANLVISFGADMLGTWLSPVHYTQDYGVFRNGSTGRERRGRWVHVEPHLSLTAANADVWLAPKPGTEAAVALALAHVIVRDGLGRGDLDATAWKEALAAFDPARVAELSGVQADRLESLARELASVKPACVVAGTNQASNATALAAAAQILNWLTGNLNDTVRFQAETAPAAADLARLSRLKASLEGGQVKAIFFIDTDPLFTLPGRLGFANALGKADFRVAFATVPNDTSAACDLVLPLATYLESWWDATPAAPVGRTVANLGRPVVSAMHESRPAEDVLLDILGGLGVPRPAANFETFLRERWSSIHKGSGQKGSSDEFWQAAVAAGGWWSQKDSTLPVTPKESRLLDGLREAAGAASRSEATSPEYKFVLYAYPSTRFYDGRHAALPWLQELPDPLTTVVWNSPVELHPDAAQTLGVKDGDVVRVESPEGAIEAPVLVFPGIRPDVVGVPIGQGHRENGRYASGRGINPLSILSLKTDEGSGSLALAATAVLVKPTGKRARVVRSQGSPYDMGTGVIQTISAKELDAAHGVRHTPPKPLHGEQVKWGMTIDLDRCTGCGACMVACSAENNIPVVGEDHCSKRRDFRWIRVERYWPDGGNLLATEGPAARFLPMMCQHCENAPCEPVCPVYATSHNQQGLNVMVYDRCVGTRYCSNNCPYKVRYFNWFEFQKMWAAPLERQHNPEVRVRMDGVMEKCTFCIQRIRTASDRAKDGGRRPLADGEVLTACQQSCPADAIVFGNLKDPEARATRQAQDARGYRVLESLNTVPSLTYLRKVTA